MLIKDEYMEFMEKREKEIYKIESSNSELKMLTLVSAVDEDEWSFADDIANIIEEIAEEYDALNSSHIYCDEYTNTEIKSLIRSILIEYDQMNRYNLRNETIEKHGNYRNNLYVYIIHKDYILSYDVIRDSSLVSVIDKLYSLNSDKCRFEVYYKNNTHNISLRENSKSICSQQGNYYIEIHVIDDEEN